MIILQSTELPLQKGKMETQEQEIKYVTIKSQLSYFVLQYAPQAVA